ncbi:hypothetical protein [Bradyrhizobium lablabi]|uniref:hypothetical protein n=1 Tax=Bradyrhizobium lablabi TaxID=722472 RepID=UPI001BAA539E|nr:hypothetical protein [Bradyrhizobium lablabi]MBR0692247.1 hypothetical protein [Bradyrhizobium lablabi]
MSIATMLAISRFETLHRYRQRGEKLIRVVVRRFKTAMVFIADRQAILPGMACDARGQAIARDPHVFGGTATFLSAIKRCMQIASASELERCSTMTDG